MRTMSKLMSPVEVSYNDGYDAGWKAHESFIEEMILRGDPGFQKWLDDLAAKSRRERDDALLEEQYHMAMQAADDEESL